MQSDIFKKKVELFRTHYKNMYGVELDDLAIYFFIRVNEMQGQLEKKIDKIPEVRFRNGWDYFMYGLGSSFKWFWVLMACAFLYLALKK